MPRMGLDAERVVDAAAGIADAEGLEAVTLARVAGELGVRAPSLYNHVDGRDDVLRAIAASIAAPGDSTMRPCPGARRLGSRARSARALASAVGRCQVAK